MDPNALDAFAAQPLARQLGPVDHLDEVRQRLVREGFAEAVRVPRFELRPSSPAAPPPRKQGVTAGCPAWAPSRGAIVSR